MTIGKLNLLKNAAALLGVAVFLLYSSGALAQAPQVAHYNSLELKRESATSVQFAFALNLPQVLHQLLAPQLTYPVFLQSYADMPDPALDRELAKASAALSAKAYFTLPSGVKANLKQWQFPDKQALRDSFKISQMLLNMPPSAASHLDPVQVLAQVQAKTPINRVQLQLPPSLYPIVVSLPNDKFWLTEQIPMAIVELP
ncbi:MAG: hypothetical protein QE283_08760 [Rhodoferax sp.]|nr:hypothetical protein [Rhodoferax sp.]